MATVKELLDIARGELGTKESPAGSNKVKYASWYGLNGQPWCVMFVMWVFSQAGVDLPVKTASCTALMNAAKAYNMWVMSGYQPGDVVIYDWGGDKVPDHCGIVESAGAATVIAIEGNTAIGNNSDGGEVMRRSRATYQILGAIRPKYQEETEVQQAEIWAKENGIMNGYEDGEMHLDNVVTRRQLLLVLYRMYNKFFK